MINPNFVFLAALLNMIGTGAYIVSTLQGKTKPNRVSFFLWSLAPMISFFAMLSEGVGISAVMTFAVGFGPLLVFLASFINKNAYWQITRFDIICGAVSLLGLVLWIITRTGVLAVVFGILADGMAALPTIRKAYIEPESENYAVFALGSISAIITMLTIQDWNFIAFGFPLYISIICMVIVVSGMLGRLRQRRGLGRA